MSTEDRLALQELNYSYAYFIDSLEPDNWANIFAPDGVLDESAFFPDALFEGRDAIRAYGETIRGNVAMMVHLMTNHIIRDLTPTTATATSFALVETMRKNGERLRFHVKYEDEYLKIGDSWKIARKTLRKSFTHENVVGAE